MTSRTFVLKSIQDEYAENTGSRPSATEASIILDRRLGAFHEKLAGAGAIYAVRDDRLLTDWLKNLWVGENNGVQGKQLRDGCIVVDAQQEIHDTWPELSPETKAKLQEKIAELTSEEAQDAEVEKQAKAWKKLLAAVRLAVEVQEQDELQRAEQEAAVVLGDAGDLHGPELEPQDEHASEQVLEAAILAGEQAIEAQQDEVPVDPDVVTHDFCIDRKRSSTRLQCSCGASSRFSRDESKTATAVEAHRAEVSVSA